MSFLTARTAILLGVAAFASTDRILWAAVRTARATRAATVAPVRTYLRVPGKPWTRTDAADRNGVLTFRFDPGKLHSDRVMLLINPPASLRLNDSESPELAAAAVDGKAIKPGRSIDLGVLNAAPRRLTLGFRDAVNAVDAASLSVRLDGRPLPRGAGPKTPGRAFTASIALPPMDWGKHQLDYRIGDTSPLANLLRGTIRFSAQDPTNRALAIHGAKITVDSCFPNYESLTAINDGFSRLSGESCGSDVTWASAEAAGEHWVTITFPTPQPIRKVTVTWAYHTGQAHSSRQIEIQAPQQDGWRALYRSPQGGEREARKMIFAFPGVTTRAIRLWQPPGGGPKDRPDLLWIAEIEAR